MLLEALEQGYSGEEPRIKAFTNQISLQVAIKALQHIKQYLSANETTDTLAREDYPKMLAHLLEKRGVYLLQDETFNRVSTQGLWQIVSHTYAIPASADYARLTYRLRGHSAKTG
jgi:hypothetical protein